MKHWGFGIEMAEKIAERIGVGIEFVHTSWPTLTADVQVEPQTFDLAIGGITITDTRKETMMMSDGYLCNGKTILCRAAPVMRAVFPCKSFVVSILIVDFWGAKLLQFFLTAKCGASK